MDTEYADVALRQLKVRSGVALQTQCQAPNAPKQEGHFLAAIDGKGVMVSHEGNVALTVGSEYHVRGFTGQYDFQFVAPVIQVFDKPFSYAMLAYPAVVRARKVRQAARMKVSLPALVHVLWNLNPLASTILDLSPFGAMFKTAISLGGTGDTVKIEVDFAFEGKPVRLTLAASIRHSHQVDANGYYTGVAFKDTTTNDKLLLHYLAHTATQQDDPEPF
jgi:hypothetical protein